MHHKIHRNPAKSSAYLIAAISAALSGAPASAQDWIDFSDVSDRRLVADPGSPLDGTCTVDDGVGTDDECEKDLAAGDVDNDGDPDVVLVRKVRFSTPGGLRNALFLNEGGVLTDRTADLAPDFLDLTDDRDVVLADVDGDGWLDVITATTFSDQPRIHMNLGLDGVTAEWLGFDWNPADARLPTFSPAPRFCAVAAGDVDNDGDLDLFFVDYSNDLEDRLLINDGDGFFTDETAARMTPAMSQSAFGTSGEIVDMNGDGARDIVKVSTLGGNPNSVRIIYNAGGKEIGTFDAMLHVYTGSPYMMHVVDLNNDDRPDVYAVDDGQDAYLINTGNDGNGHALFTELDVTGSPRTSSLGGNVKSGDFDRDGFADVLVADIDVDIPGCSRRLTALRNQGDTPLVTLSDPLDGDDRPWLTYGTFDIAIADFNGDGMPDVWSGTCDGNRLFVSSGGLFSDGFESGDIAAWNG